MGGSSTKAALREPACFRRVRSDHQGGRFAGERIIRKMISGRVIEWIHST
jgi:hypothetical protein